MDRFNILRYAVPDRLRNRCPEGVNLLKFENRDVICIWFKNAILLYDGIDFNELQMKQASSKDYHVLFLDGAIVNILQLGDDIGVFNGIGLYFLTKRQDRTGASFSGREHDLSQSDKNVLKLKLRMKLHHVMALGTLNSGFTLVKRKSGRLYLDVYRTGPRLATIDKICSVELLQFIHAEVSCVLTCVKYEDLDPILSSLLVQDMAMLKSQVVFVGLNFGHVYCIPVTDGQAAPKPKLVYSSRHPIKDIMFIRDKESVLYSHIGIVLTNGPMIYITSYEQKLHYRMVHLPGATGHCCLGREGIVTADGVDLWYSKLSWSSEGKLSVENKMVGVKGVRSVCLVPNSQLILAVTHYLTLYWINPENVTSDDRPGNIVVPTNTMTNIDRSIKDLAKLKHEMLLEEKAMEAVSIGMRDRLLQNSFSVQVQVHSSSTVGQYVFEIELKNTIDQDYFPDVWSLYTCVNTGSGNITETSKLEQRVRKGTSLTRSVKASIPETVYCAKISCGFVSRISEKFNSDITSWEVIPIASTDLDISYFFSPSAIVSGSTVTEDLSRIAQSYMQEDDESLDWNRSRETKEHTLLFRMRRERAEPSNIWAAVIKNCRHNFTDVEEGRDLTFYVKCHVVKMSLNEDCSVMKLKCSDLEVLHLVKTSLIHLLKENSSQRSVYVSRDIFSKAQKLKENLELEAEEVQKLKDDWRYALAKCFPLV